MRIATSGRGSRARRWLAAPAMAIVTAALTLTTGPATAATAGTGGPVTPYQGLTAAQQASLLGIARDTWKFYQADVDPATHLPMDNLTFAGGSATPTSVRPVHLRRQHRGVPVGSGRGPGPRADQPGRGHATWSTATLTEVAHLKRFDGFLYQWYDTTNGDVLSNPGDVDCATETDAGVRQLLLRLQRGQRLVRLGPDRGPAGHARAGQPGRTA